VTALDDIRERRWFYRFELPDGTATDPYVPDDVATIHEARAEMAKGVIHDTFGTDLTEVDAVDVACHQGWFTSMLLDLGVRHTLGVDIRPEHLHDAALMMRVLGHDDHRVSFQPFDVGNPSDHPLERDFDIVLLLGLIYHLENPVGALRVARRLTRRLCLVETQIATSLSGVTDWGSYRSTKQIKGSFAIIDETHELTAENREANTVSVSLCPDINGLVFLMRAVGFDRVEVVQPSQLNEQLANGKRAMVAGWID
jgi:SAM-dependent methyltransferase